MFKALTSVVFLLLAASSALAAQPYHLVMEAYPAAAFPFLSKFGTTTIHVYPLGVRAETFWLNGFSQNGSQTVTVENPLGRMYTEIPLTQISANLHKLSNLGKGIESAAPATMAKPFPGSVRGISAVRYRLQYGPQAWIDVWTTGVVPENPQYRAIVQQFIQGISPATASVMRAIPGTPVYVELNFRRYQKLPLLKLTKFERSAEGEADALKIGSFYFKAPLLDSIWK
jgi:hypothetical protein